MPTSPPSFASPVWRPALYPGHCRDLNRPWERVLNMARQYNYPKGIFRFDESMQRDFYYISQGRICAQAFSLSGRERSTLFFEEGSLFNLAACLLDYSDNGEWYCMEEVIIWRFSGTLLRDASFLQKYPELIINLMQGMSFNLMTQYIWLTDMYLAHPHTRFCRYLVGICMASGGKLRFSLGMTQQEIATELGMHRATLAAALQTLRVQKIVGKFSKKEVHILDWERLQEQANS